MEPNLDEVAKMDLTEDATTLMSPQQYSVEKVYAEYANKLKALANECRRVSRTAPVYKRKPEMTEKYKDEVATIESKVADRKKKSPLERKAQALAEIDMKLKIDADPSIKEDRERYQKEVNRSVLRARNQLSVGDVDIHLSDKEWAAVFDGALNGDTFLYLMKHCDPIELNSHAFNKKDDYISDSRVVAVKEMNRLGYSRAQIIDHTGLSPKIIKEILE